MCFRKVRSGIYGVDIELFLVGYTRFGTKALLVPFIFYATEMAIYKVKKRNGIIVTFDKIKIESAIQKAIESVGGSDFDHVPAMVDAIAELIETKVGKNIPDVETIQDSVEETLIKEGHDKVAKSYILYREKRNESRQEKKVMIDVADTMEEYL